MKSTSRLILRIAAVCLLLVAFVLVAGCSRHPNEQELKALEETEQAALAAEGKAADCAKEKASLEQQLAEKKQKVEKMTQEKATVEKRLAEWQ
jgi:septal ring factor EnvC (AmiA/AmiB activator)